MNRIVRENLRVFYVSYRQQLYTYALSITRDRAAAEDAIHAAFQQLLRRSDLPADFRPYIFRCVRNAALDAFRRAKTQADWIFKVRSESEPVCYAPTDALSLAALDASLCELSEMEREAVVLKIYSGLTFHEIADLHGVPLPTVASWYRRGIDKLKNLLAGELR
jgi:RNA polymerase sigma-70 factor (ECF subfamily)